MRLELAHPGVNTANLYFKGEIEEESFFCPLIPGYRDRSKARLTETKRARTKPGVKKYKVYHVIERGAFNRKRSLPHVCNILNSSEEWVVSLFFFLPGLSKCMTFFVALVPPVFGSASVKASVHTGQRENIDSCWREKCPLIMLIRSLNIFGTRTKELGARD